MWKRKTIEERKKSFSETLKSISTNFIVASLCTFCLLVLVDIDFSSLIFCFIFCFSLSCISDLLFNDSYFLIGFFFNGVGSATPVLNICSDCQTVVEGNNAKPCQCGGRLEPIKNWKWVEPEENEQSEPKNKILNFLKDYPELDLLEDTSSIVVFSDDKDGFDVTFKETNKNYIVSFGRWSESLPKTDDGARRSVSLFKFGLSDNCRLKLFRKGKIDYKCILEFKNGQNNNWTAGSKKSLSLSPVRLIGQLEVRYLGNKLIEGTNFGSIYTETKPERKHGKFLFFWIAIWSFSFLMVYKSVGTGNLIVFCILLMPFIIVGFFLPVFLFIQKQQNGKKD